MNTYIGYQANKVGWFLPAWWSPIIKILVVVLLHFISSQLKYKARGYPECSTGFSRFSKDPLITLIKFPLGILCYVVHPNICSDLEHIRVEFDFSTWTISCYLHVTRTPRRVHLDVVNILSSVESHLVVSLPTATESYIILFPRLFLLTFLLSCELVILHTWL